MKEALRNPIDVALFVAKSYIGKWYTWGGDDPSGIDCSGLMVAVLKASGQLPRRGDWNADMLMKDRNWEPATDLEPGCLVFWGKDGKATHVEMVIGRDNINIWTIGASGGGRNTRTQDDAIRQNAFVKIRPVRSDYIATRDPFVEYRE